MILEKKALAAIEAYKVDMVVANILASSRSLVHLYHKSGVDPVAITAEEDTDIEAKMIDYIDSRFPLI